MTQPLNLTLTLPAMERLLGGDTELEIGLKRGLAQEFAKRHLESILNEEVTNAVNTLRSEIKAVAEAAVRAAFFADPPKTVVGKYITISEIMRTSISEEVRGLVRPIVEEVLRSTIVRDQSHLQQIATRYVDSRLKDVTENELKKAVQDKLKRAIHFQD